MSRSRRIFFSSLAGLVLCLSSAVLAKADPLVFTLTDPGGGAGSTVLVTGTFTNSGPTTIFLNSAGVSVSLGATAIVLFNGPLSLAPGETTTNLVLFSFKIPGFASNGMVFNGTFAIFGGSTNLDNGLLAWQEYSITVGPTAVPEPATLVLLATGLAGAVGSKRVRHRFTKN